MYIDTKIYHKNNLSEKGKAVVNEAEAITEALLSPELIEEYITANYTGKMTTALFGETIMNYIKFLRERRDELVEETIVELIEEEDSNGDEK